MTMRCQSQKRRRIVCVSKQNTYRNLYQRFRKQTKSFLEGIPKVGGQVTKIALKAEETLKGLFLPGILFEELGINYVRAP